VPSLQISSQTASAAGFEYSLADALIQLVGEPRYNLWFRTHTKFVLIGNEVVVGVPNLYFHDWLQKTFGTAVREAVIQVVGHGTTVRFAIDADLFQAARAQEDDVVKPARETSRKQSAREPEPKEAPRAEKTKAPRTPKRRWRSLNDFIVGTSNRVAHASAMSVVEEPGLGANPLVLYGPTGTGKTHLLEGIYLGLRKRQGDSKVIFISAEDFMNRFVSALHLGKQSSFRKQFRECYALLIDDLSFLAGKKASQVEFLHTFDALLAEGCQVVVTCDCHPRLSEDLMPELVDRLVGGAVWSVLPPDQQTRLALLKAKTAGPGPNFPNEVTAYLASHLRGNVRELEGAIHSVRHYSRVNGQPITKDLAKEALGDLLRHAVRVVRIADVETAVCLALKLPSGALKTKSRAWSVSHARMLAIYLARKHTAATYGEISLHFGNKTHSTAVAAEKKVRGWMAGKEAIKAGDREWKITDLIDRIERELHR
jgi:chromosomal replication initiator protein